ncbi:hypothetical protein A0J61_06945 [Choanephora cucurbitarum]|uniref:Uncharacterized protein n=1 Tax=Choanephora cucurbitarum TaxID=101091 RepID=A0A1C7N785_9FUNG|nr:hypothetical protein A0J61_06945 [Choanephora cucurbitarum]
MTTESTEEKSMSEELMTSDNTTQTSLSTNSSDSCPGSDDNIAVERFAQLLSTHWQFDHLDALKSGTYKVISEEFQKHIRVSIEEPSTQSRQKAFGVTTAAVWDMMDLEILHAQIYGAIQAHTEGSLHIEWDKLADKLGQPAFDSFIRDVTSRYCSTQDGLLSSACLVENATKLSVELDAYVQHHLVKIFTALDQEVLPRMLNNTSRDLLDVLKYFNRLFSSGDRQQLYLQVTPWTQTADIKLKLLPLLEKSTLADDHLVDFFSSYACLSRA